MLLEVSRTCDQNEMRETEVARDERRIGETARTDRDVEGFFDQVHGAIRAKHLELDPAAPCQELAEDRAQELRARRYRHAQQAARRFLQLRYRAVSGFNLGYDADAVIVVDSPCVGEA